MLIWSFWWPWYSWIYKFLWQPARPFILAISTSECNYSLSFPTTKISALTFWTPSPAVYITRDDDRISILVKHSNLQYRQCMYILCESQVELYPILITAFWIQDRTFNTSQNIGRDNDLTF